MIYLFVEGKQMDKTYSMNIWVSEEELNRLKQATRLEAYTSYSEYVRQAALKQVTKRP